MGMEITHARGRAGPLTSWYHLSRLLLDPLPRIAGVASSIIGTIQNAVGASSALIAAAIYDGSVRNAVLLIGIAGLAVAALFLLRPWIAPGDLVHHPDELARD